MLPQALGCVRLRMCCVWWATPVRLQGCTQPKQQQVVNCDSRDARGCRYLLPCSRL
jgi:hypothetical protein